MIGVRKFLPAKVGCTSLVGISGEAPHSFGNYFDLWDGSRVFNMWAENLEALVRDGTLSDRKIEVLNYSTGCIVVDPRVPPEYLNNKCCFTGGRRPTLEEAKEIYEILGDPTNELEQWTDPVSYYEKRGGKYDPQTGFVTYTVKSRPRKLKAKWKYVQSDAAIVHAPFIPINKA